MSLRLLIVILILSLGSSRLSRPRAGCKFLGIESTERSGHCCCCCHCCCCWCVPSLFWIKTTTKFVPGGECVCRLYCFLSCFIIPQTSIDGTRYHTSTTLRSLLTSAVRWGVGAVLSTEPHEDSVRIINTLLPQ